MKKSLGKLRAGAIGMMELPPLPSDILDGFRALPDLTGMSSDAMDELGITGVVPAALLHPTDPKARIVGRALTVRNVAAPMAVAEAVQAGVSMLAEIEAHNLAEPGDILVLQGVDQVSNMPLIFQKRRSRGQLMPCARSKAAIPANTRTPPAGQTVSSMERTILSRRPLSRQR